MAIALGLVLAAALVILVVALISPHQPQRRKARDQGCDYTADGGWNPAFVTGDSGGSDCSAGDAGGGCDGGGGD